MKKIGIIVGIVVCACVLGLGIYHSSASVTSPKMSEADIKKMVTEQYPGEIASIEKRKELHNTVYEVELKDSAKGYTLKVDGDTGEILKMDEKMLATTSDQVKEKDSQKSDSKSDSNTEDRKDEVDVTDKKEDKAEKKPEDEPQSEQKKDTSAKDEKKAKDKSSSKEETTSDKQTVIDMKEAIQIGLNEYPGTITEIELDTEDDQLIYEVEIVSGNQKAKIDIHAYTGEVLLIGTESTDGMKGDTGSLISIQRAMDIALKEFSGTIIEVELEEEEDGYMYEVEIKSGDTEMEIEIDAYTGNIVDTD